MLQTKLRLAFFLHASYVLILIENELQLQTISAISLKSAVHKWSGDVLLSDEDGKPVYICICNALTDRKLQDTISTSNSNSPDELYAACGCRAKCGKCVRAVREMLRDHGRRDAALQPTA